MVTSYNFSPILFDATVNGVYTFKTVLAYHKSIENHMPMDGIVWLCENPNIEKLSKRQDDLRKEIEVLKNGMKNQPYGVWTILDREAHKMKARLQLVTLCIDNYYSSNN